MKRASDNAAVRYPHGIYTEYSSDAEIAAALASIDRELSRRGRTAAPRQPGGGLGARQVRDSAVR